MTMAIFKGNKSRLLAIRPNNEARISGIAHLNTWIQSTDPVEGEFVESFADSEARWEVISASSDDHLLQERLSISQERLSELRQSNEFGALRCNRSQSDPSLYNMDLAIVVPDRQFKHIAYFLRSVMRNENTFYAHAIYLDDYPAEREGFMRLPWTRFKDGEPLYYSSARFGFRLIEEKHPDSRIKVETARTKRDES